MCSAERNSSTCSAEKPLSALSMISVFKNEGEEGKELTLSIWYSEKPELRPSASGGNGFLRLTVRCCVGLQCDLRDFSGVNHR